MNDNNELNEYVPFVGLIHLIMMTSELKLTVCCSFQEELFALEYRRGETGHEDDWLVTDERGTELRAFEQETRQTRRRL